MYAGNIALCYRTFSPLLILLLYILSYEGSTGAMTGDSYTTRTRSGAVLLPAIFIIVETYMEMSPVFACIFLTS